ncbi:MAG: reverse transcriptase family protein [Patescibacteria group bacterium]
MKIPSDEIKNIKTLENFCRFFAISEEQLVHFRKHKNELFKVAKIGKRSGGHRIIYPIGDDGYRNFLKATAEILDDHYMHNSSSPPQSVHGFLRNRSIITNAQCHVKKKILLNLDIKDFFESITKDKINEIFIDLGFSKNHSSILTEFVTVNDVLATGFPSSAVLANIVCKQMDYGFEILCKKYEATYTRYADDISISSNISIPEKEVIVKLLCGYGFEINDRKYKISPRGGNQYVTGLTVCDERPRLSRKLKRSIRLELYYIKKYGSTDHFLHNLNRSIYSKFTGMLFTYSMGGYISFIHSIEPELAKKIRKVLSYTKIKANFFLEE